MQPFRDCRPSVTRRRFYDAATPGNRLFVILIRGTNTKYEWHVDFEYSRVSNAKFAATAPENEFPGDYFEGETHSGFTKVFNAIWPTIQQVSKYNRRAAPAIKCLLSPCAVARSRPGYVADTNPAWRHAGAAKGSVVPGVRSPVHAFFPPSPRRWRSTSSPRPVTPALASSESWLPASRWVAASAPS